mmetsp:Transcript_21094/g.45895  ORF Transcript_21094/g.45895 Transcript_21094/m.45895 type:complete len:221 (-) Transcript_21094:742-1404(-)
MASLACETHLIDETTRTATRSQETPASRRPSSTASSSSRLRLHCLIMLESTSPSPSASSRLRDLEQSRQTQPLEASVIAETTGGTPVAEAEAPPSCFASCARWLYSAHTQWYHRTQTAHCTQFCCSESSGSSDCSVRRRRIGTSWKLESGTSRVPMSTQMPSTLSPDAPCEAAGCSEGRHEPSEDDSPLPRLDRLRTASLPPASSLSPALPPLSPLADSL